MVTKIDANEEIGKKRSMKAYSVPPNTVWKVYDYKNECLGVYSGHPADIAAFLAKYTMGRHLLFVHDPLPIEVKKSETVEKQEVVVYFEGHGVGTLEEVEWLESGKAKTDHTAREFGTSIVFRYPDGPAPVPILSRFRFEDEKNP